MTWLERVEALVVRGLARGLALLPPAVASDFFGGVARLIGPWLPVSKVAEANLRAAMPELGAAERARIIKGVWEQVGRTAGEFPHLKSLPFNSASGPGWACEGVEALRDLQEHGGPAIFFSGHIGNWEMFPRAAREFGMPVGTLYRAAQNVAVDALIARLRRQATGETLKLFPKGAKGARQAMLHLRAGGFLAMLVDQKMNDGVAASLFGLKAMTAPAAASLALHFKCPLIPAYCERVGSARLRLVVEPALALPSSGDRQADILALTQQMNDVLERWIRARPESWLWLHRRWPKEALGARPASPPASPKSDAGYAAAQ